jgi:hypothetical protein
MNGAVGAGSGLRPGLAISVDPRGIPAPLVPNAGGMVIGAMPLSTGVQALEMAPGMPPPSNVEVWAAPVAQPVLADGAGLMPDAVSSVAPSGMPTGPTPALGPIASGVAASGDGLAWPKATPQPSRLTMRTVVEKLAFMIRFPVKR